MKAKEYENIKIIRYEESIYYANVDNFKYKVLKLVNLNPQQILADINVDLAKEFKALNEAYTKQVNNEHLLVIFSILSNDHI